MDLKHIEGKQIEIEMRLQDARDPSKFRTMFYRGVLRKDGGDNLEIEDMVDGSTYILSKLFFVKAKIMSPLDVNIALVKRNTIKDFLNIRRNSNELDRRLKEFQKKL